MTAAKNFMGKLTFELASFSIPFGESYNFSKSWVEVAKQLNNSSDFGRELNRSNLFKTVLTTLVTADMSQHTKAKKNLRLYKNANQVEQIVWTVQ